MRSQKYNESLLVSRICFNRHHMADGVKNFNQETWKLLFTGDKGKELLCKYANDVCKFYETQLNSPNHQVREAACLAVSEIYLRLAQYDKEAFKPFAGSFVQILMTKVKEPYYAVRNQSITALSNIVSAYKEELSELIIADMISLWFSRLSENVGTVRESAAIALVANASNLNLADQIKDFIKLNLLKAKEQKPEAPL